MSTLSFVVRSFPRKSLREYDMCDKASPTLISKKMVFERDILHDI